MSLFKELFGKPKTLKDVVREVEESALKDGVWGSNLETLIITTRIIQDHYIERFDVDRFIKTNQQRIILLPFNNMDEAIGYLRDIRKLLDAGIHSRDMMNETFRDMGFPAKGSDVRFKELIVGRNGYNIDILKYVELLIREVGIIHGNLELVSKDIVNTIKSRVVAIINGLLIINELIIEDIILE